MNEAKFQNRFESRIRKTFPMLPAKVEFEEYLKLKLGHKEITIDFKNSNKNELQGRYDILVKSDCKPLLLFELKSPDSGISDVDIRQGLSYARLHQPLVPLVVITDDTDTHILNAYTGEHIDKSLPENSTLKCLIQNIAKTAADDSENACKALLGTSETVWSEIFFNWNSVNIAELTGDISDISTPIARGFYIPRKIDCQIITEISNHNVICVHGDPLSGITCTLSKFAMNEAVKPCLYINCRDVSDVLCSISDRLSAEMGYTISKEDFRGWINTCGILANITLVLDSPNDSHLEELLDLSNRGLVKIVLGVSTEWYNNKVYYAGRSQRSLLGRISHPIELTQLDDDEFINMYDELTKNFGLFFYNGAQYNPLLRHPQHVRLVVGWHSCKLDINSDTKEFDILYPILPITEPFFFNQLLQLVQGNELKKDLRSISELLINDIECKICDKNYRNKQKNKWINATWGRPSFDPNYIEQHIGHTRIDWLTKYDYLSLIEINNVETRYLIKQYELLGTYIAKIFKSRIIDSCGSSNFVETIESNLHISKFLLYGDQIIALSFLQIFEENYKVFSDIVNFLLSKNSEPTQVTNGNTFDLLLKGDNNITLTATSDDEENSKLYSCYEWLVLSHLLSIPLGIKGYRMTANLSIFIFLGTCQHQIFYPTPCALRDAIPLQFHEISDNISLLCHNTGIVEPLVQAMLKHAIQFPNEFEYLVNKAISIGNPHLINRALAVAGTLHGGEGDNGGVITEETYNKLNNWIKDFIEHNCDK